MTGAEAEAWARARGSLLGFVLLCVVIFLTGCPVPPPVPNQHAPKQLALVSSRSAEAAYQCAAHLFATQPGMAHVHSDATTHVMSGEWHRAVDMVLTVDPLPASSRITLSGSVPATRQVTGTFSEVDDLAALVKEACL